MEQKKEAQTPSGLEGLIDLGGGLSGIISERASAKIKRFITLAVESLGDVADSDNSESSESSESSENSESSESSESKEQSEGLILKSLLTVDPDPSQWGTLLDVARQISQTAAVQNR